MNKLAALRKEKQLTQKELSILSGVSRSRISELENSKGDITGVNLILLSKALAVDPNELIGWNDIKDKSLDELKYLYYSSGNI